MSEENKAVVRRFYEELDKGNFDIYDELCTPDFVSHFLSNPEPQDRETRKVVSRKFYDAISEAVHTLEDVIAEGDTVAARGTARGIHTGEYMSRPPTGNKIMFSGMRFYRMVRGKIAEEWASFDSLTVMRQLGLVPPPEESAS